MASEVGICNRALQLLGSSSIISLTQDIKKARECNLAYESLRDAELRRHTWNFSKKRIQLAADSETPDFEFDFQYTIPSTALRIILPRGTIDWQVEGRMILTNDGAPLDVTYVDTITDPNTFDSLFREMLSARIAMELCETITQSNTKKQAAAAAYAFAQSEARRINAFEHVPTEATEDTWISSRR